MMTKKNFETNTPNLDLFPVNNKNVELSFSGEEMSSDGGLLHLREVENQLGLIESVSGCISDSRDFRYTSHSIKELISQRVFQIAAGYEDCNDSNSLRKDKIFKMCAGRHPQSGDDLASQPTMSRLENSVSRKDLYKMGQEVVSLFIASYEHPPKVIILDCDDTNNNTYGQQQLTLYNHFYRDYCYMPLHIYEGQSGKLVTTVLRPGQHHKQSHVASLLKKVVNYLREQWKDTMIILRGDSHFCSRDLMEWCEDQPKTAFITGLSRNKALMKKAQVTIESAQRRFEQNAKPVKSYHSFRYKAKTWNTEQKVVAKVEVTSMGTNVRFIVTNLFEYRAKQLYEKGYCARCAMELRIKEHKLYLKSSRSSCASFYANQFRLFMHSVAYILLHTMQKELFKGTEFENASFKTIQNKIIKTAAWVKELKTKIKVEFPKTCPTRELQTRSFKMLCLLRN